MSKVDPPDGAVLLLQKSDRVAVFYSTSEWKGEQYVGIREHILKDGKWIPTKSGVNMPVTMWPMLQKAIGEIKTVKGSTKSTKSKLSEGDVRYFALLHGDTAPSRKELQKIAAAILEQGTAQEKRSKIPPQRGRVLYKLTVEEGGTYKVRPHSDCSTTKPLTWEKR